SALLFACSIRKPTSPVILVEVVTASVLVYLVATEERPRVFRALDLPPVRFTGRISYSFYLLHMVGLAVATMIAPASSLAELLLAISITLPMAWVSWKYIEIPFLHLRASRKSEHPHDVVADDCRLHDSVRQTTASTRIVD